MTRILADNMPQKLDSVYTLHSEVTIMKS